jgi:integrase
MSAGIIERPLADGGVTYWIVFTWQKRQIWERAGRVKRDAQTLLTLRRREVKEGTYLPPKDRAATTFGQFARQWLDNRRTRSAEDEDRWVRDYVLRIEWLEKLPLMDLAPRHMEKLVDELKVTLGRKTQKPLSPKSVANIYGVVSTIIRDARIQELIPRDPCVISRGKLARKSTVRRGVYEAHEVRALISDKRLAPDVRMWNALAFLTGMREGEVCGRRWRDYDPSPKPLGAITVATQYDDQPLKTDKEGETRPRVVPVHPVLAWMLERWHAGFELVHCRAPRPEDFIVTNRMMGGNHTKSSAYKAFQKALATLSIPNRTLHSTRHTMITLARRGGARKDVLERITHNAKGDVVDTYTHWDWAPLCEAVLCLNIDFGIAHARETPSNVVEAPGIEPGRVSPRLPASEELDASGTSQEPPSPRPETGPRAGHGERHPGVVGARAQTGRSAKRRPRTARAAADDRLAEVIFEGWNLSEGDDVADHEAAVADLLAEGAKLWPVGVAS